MSIRNGHPLLYLGILALIVGALQLVVWHVTQQYGTTVNRARRAVGK